jgi:hypothetical protein
MLSCAGYYLVRVILCTKAHSAKGYAMSKYNVEITGDKVLFVSTQADSKGNHKVVSENLYEAVDNKDIVPILRKELRARDSASQACVSLLVNVFKSTSLLDTYKGNTPMQDTVPSTFNKALRRAEEDYIATMPQFVEIDNSKGERTRKVNDLIEELRNGSYANAKSHISKLFCKLGQLPLAPNGKQFTVAAVMKIVADKEEESREKADNSISAKIYKIYELVNNRKDDKPLDFGALPTAIAALKQLLATFEGLEREAAERLTEQLQGATAHDAVTSATVAITKASDIPSQEDLTAIWQNNGMTDDEYKIKMLSFHNIDVNIAEEAVF